MTKRILFSKAATLMLMLCISSAQYAAAQCTGSNGLTGNYYDGYFDDDLLFFGSATVQQTRVDATINFATGGWALNPPLNDEETYSSTHAGSVIITTTGNYTFTLTSDDASYMWLGNAALAPTLANAAINNGGQHGPTPVSATVFLSAGQTNILIYYGENVVGNALTLEYSGPSIPTQIVPTSALCTTVLPFQNVPQSVTYSPSSASTLQGTAVSSAVPTVADGGSPVTNFIIINAGSLPAGITINPTTGVLTADNSVGLGSYTTDVAATNANGSATFTGVFTFQVSAPPPPGCTGPAGFSGSYYAGYFSNTDGDGGADSDADLAFFNNPPALTRNDALINFNTNDSWGNIAPPAAGTAADPDNYSARFTSRLFIAAAGTYTFYLTSDDASYMWLDAPALAPTIANALINNGGLHGAATQSGTIALTAGYHDALIYYGEQGGGNILTFEYESIDAGVPRQLFPANALCDLPLPVELSSFSGAAQRVNNAYSVRLNWITASEKDNRGFILLRDNQDIARYDFNTALQGKGTVNTASYYSFIDATAEAGRTYTYALRSVDFSGISHTYPQTVTVNVTETSPAKPVESALLQNYPNPFNPTTVIRFTMKSGGAARLKVYDMLGREVFTQTLQATAGDNQVRFDGSALASGAYYYQLTAAGFSQIRKMVIVK